MTQQRQPRTPAARSTRKGPPTFVGVYENSPMCRAIHVTGAYGGVTPSLEVVMSLYNERNKAPIRTEYDAVGGQLIERPVVASGPATVVRQVEVEAIMTVDFCKSLIEWLQHQVDQAEKIRSGQKPLTTSRGATS